MRWLKHIPNRATVGLLAVLSLLLLLLPIGIWAWVGQERARLVKRLQRDRLETLSKVADDIEEDLQDVTDHLKFVGKLVRSSQEQGELRRSLVALLSTSRAYRALSLFDRKGRKLVSVTDPRRPLAASQRINATEKRVIHLVRHRGAGELLVSPSVELNRKWFRVFSVRLSGVREGGHLAIVTLIVDMRPFLGRLRLASADPNTEILVFSPHGHVAWFSTPRVVSAARKTISAKKGTVFASVLGRMKRGGRGAATIAESEATSLGLGRSDLVIAYAPIRVRGGRDWSVATLNSMGTIHKHESALMIRLLLGAAGVVLLIVTIVVFLLRSSYRLANMGERLQNAQEIAHLNEKAGLVLSSIPTGVIVLGEEDRITDLNEAMKVRLKTTWQGCTLGEVFPNARKEVFARLEDLVGSAKASGKRAGFVGERLSLFGSPGHYRIHAAPICPPRQDASALLIIEDITELKALEDQILRTEKLSTIGTLSAGIAHEIGTPLAVVRGRTEQALSRLGPEHPQTGGLRTVIEQTDRVIRIVRELLDYSRTNAAVSVSTQVGEVVNRSLELLHFEATSRRLSVSVDLEDGLPPVAANTDQLQQVLVNLLMNAFDASAPQGVVRIVGQIDRGHRAEENRRYVSLTIEDRGCGIPPEAKHRILDPFYTTKKRGQGTGLGLFIVSQIVRNHGADMSFHSEHGRGTSVRLSWPVRPEKEAV